MVLVYRGPSVGLGRVPGLGLGPKQISTFKFTKIYYFAFMFMLFSKSNTEYWLLDQLDIFSL